MVHDKLVAMGFPGTDRTTRRAVAQRKAARIFQRIGGIAYYTLTDDEKIITSGHIAGVPVPHLGMATAGRRAGCWGSRGTWGSERCLRWCTRGRGRLGHLAPAALGPTRGAGRVAPWHARATRVQALVARTGSVVHEPISCEFGDLAKVRDGEVGASTARDDRIDLRAELRRVASRPVFSMRPTEALRGLSRLLPRA